MRNLPILRNHGKISQTIWGISVPYLKVKITRRQPDAVEFNTETINPIPPDILEDHEEIIISMDIMNVNKVTFLTTISRGLQFGSATEL